MSTFLLRIESAVSERIAQGNGSGIVFVRTKAEARILAAALNVPWVTSERSKSERATIAAQLQSGTLAAVVATSAWSTGVNIPNLRWVMLTSRGKAPVGVLQSAGRTMRTGTDKPGYEIINVVDSEDPTSVCHAIERNAVLATAGFQSGDTAFLQDLLTQLSTAQPTCNRTGYQRHNGNGAERRVRGGRCASINKDTTIAEPFVLDGPAIVWKACLLLTVIATLLRTCL